MNTETALSGYIMQVIDCVKGSKVLYLDVETRGIISQLLSQTEALAHNIFLIHQLGVPINEKTHSNLAHLSAIVLVRPTSENIDELIKRHLRHPKHASYYLFFTNQLEEHELSQMAQADEHEVVQGVMEYFADYYPINRDLWSLQLSRQMALYVDEKAWSTDEHESIERQLKGLSAFLLSVKKRPIIRYTKNSPLCEKMGNLMYKLIENEKQLFGWSQLNTTPLLLILDRRDDPITPLLSQWTYQAMVHELLTINNSRVDMRHTNPKNKEMEELVLNAFDKQNDSFFNKNLNATFGELGGSVKRMVDSHTASMQSNKNLKSVQDMQKFVENYGSFLTHSGMVSKHVAILTELSSLVNKKKLLDLSSIEQEIVCGNMPKDHFKEVERQICNPSIPDFDKLRLGIIYCIRYEKHESNISKIRALLRDNLSNEDNKKDVELINIMLRQFGAKKRSCPLFEEEEKGNFMQKIKRSMSNVQGVENIYTQHNPLLHNLLEKSIKGKLPLTEFPVCGNSTGWSNQELPKEIIVYFMGGATYEEALAVTQLNERYKDVRIVLGSGFVHNSKSFLNDVKKTFASQI